MCFRHSLILMVRVLCCADLVFWDMPYGLLVAPWDVLLTDVEVEEFFKQVAVINRARNHTMVLSINCKDYGRMWTFMTQNGYSDIHPLYVYKPQQNMTGMGWIFAVEQMIVGYKGGIQNCAVTFVDNHPLFRHNLFFGLQVGSKLKYVGEDEEVNTTQKNPNVASFIGRILCKVGSSALVIGAGSGSEVVGLARVGVQVVALEKDPKQFVALTLRLTAEASFQAKALKQAADEEETCELLRVCAAGCTRLIRDRKSHFVQAVEEGEDEEPAASSSSSSSAAPAAERKCAVCGEALGLKPQVVCAKDECLVGALHAGCCERCPSCKKLFCSSAHNLGHTCVPAA